MLHRYSSQLLLLAAVGLTVGCAETTVEYYPCPEGMDCTGDSPEGGDPGSNTAGSGGPCTKSTDCDVGACVTKDLLAALGVDTTYVDVPNGMCSLFPCADDNDCATGGICVVLTEFTGSDDSLCLRSCAHLGDCRWKEDYTCLFPWPAEPETGVCLPDSVVVGIYCPEGACE